MARQASKVVQIEYVVVPQNGTSVLIDGNGNFFTSTNPTQAQLTLTKEKLEAIRDKAETAKTTADTAQETADSKPTMKQVTDQIFKVYYDGDYDNPRATDNLEFFMNDGKCQVSYCYMNGKTPTCNPLGYLVSASFIEMVNTLKTEFDKQAVLVNQLKLDVAKLKGFHNT